MRAWFGLRVRGAEHVPASGPALIVSNHQSILDPPIIGGAARRQIYFLAKAELFRIPVFGWLIRALHARPVRREGSDPGALRTAALLLEEGKALLVFPEGTRSLNGRLGERKPGVGMLAVTSGAPVVPAYVSGTLEALPKGSAWPRRSQVIGMMVTEAVLATGVGGLIGVVLGVLMMRLFERSLVYYLEKVGVPFVWVDTPRTIAFAMGAIVLASVIGALGVLYPAWRASRRDAYDLVRSEG